MSNLTITTNHQPRAILAHISVPVSPDTSFADLRAALHSELNQGAIMGSDERMRDDSGAIGDAWFKAAHAAINRDVKPAVKGAGRPFRNLDATPDDHDGDEVMAFFVFTDADA
jgi:hypothetical protein